MVGRGGCELEGLGGKKMKENRDDDRDDARKKKLERGRKEKEMF